MVVSLPLPKNQQLKQKLLAVVQMMDTVSLPLPKNQQLKPSIYATRAGFLSITSLAKEPATETVRIRLLGDHDGVSLPLPKNQQLKHARQRRGAGGDWYHFPCQRTSN